MVKEIFNRHGFLFSELVKRDFKKKYKRTYLGVLWSLFSPLLSLLVMRIAFTHFFGREIEHYTTYLFCGNIIFSFFSEATGSGMTSLISNADIFTKIKLPKYLFLLSKSISSLINFLITFLAFLIFTAIDGVRFTPYFLLLIIPMLCLAVFNLGLGLILSALYVFFRDLQYLWGVFTTLVMYLSAIFYNVADYPEHIRSLFLLNPVYVYIDYFRIAVLEARAPSLTVNLLALGYALIALLIGSLIYRKNSNKFLYYV